MSVRQSCFPNTLLCRRRTWAFACKYVPKLILQSLEGCWHIFPECSERFFESLVPLVYGLWIGVVSAAVSVDLRHWRSKKNDENLKCPTNALGHVNTMSLIKVIKSGDRLSRFQLLSFALVCPGLKYKSLAQVSNLDGSAVKFGNYFRSFFVELREPHLMLECGLL